MFCTNGQAGFKTGGQINFFVRIFPDKVKSPKTNRHIDFSGHPYKVPPEVTPTAYTGIFNSFIAYYMVGKPNLTASEFSSSMVVSGTGIPLLIRSFIVLTSISPGNTNLEYPSDIGIAEMNS